MNYTINENNEVLIKGVIDEMLELSHIFMYQRFYKTKISVSRKSGTKDFIPVIIPEIYTEGIVKGKNVEILGELHSFNYLDEVGKNHVKIFLFAKKIFFVNEHEEDENFISIKGYICKTPIFRETPLGRYISDLTIAVNRRYGKSDYLHCIAWGKNAIEAGEWKVGDEVIIKGRVQSRNYFKRISPDSEDGEWKEVYEISASCAAKTII